MTAVRDHVHELADLEHAHALIAEATVLVHQIVDAHPHEIAGPVVTAMTKLDMDAAAADRDITVVGRYLGLPR